MYGVCFTRSERLREKTIVRTLTTLLRPDSGTAHIDDYDVVNEAQSVRSIKIYLCDR